MKRRTQFVIRQNRYRRRRQHMYQRGFEYELRPGPDLVIRWYKKQRVTPLWNGPVMFTPIVKHHRNWFFPLAGFPLVWSFHYKYKIGYQSPPVVVGTGFRFDNWHSIPLQHQREAIAGVQRKSVRAIGHKPDRMTGWERMVWGAGTQAYLQGFFPDWDPLHRSPTEAQILAGAPLYTGPFPQTPRGTGRKIGGP